jgi:hypothetical protein
MMTRWGKPFKDGRNWKEYNEQLVVRGEFLLDLDFSERWFSDIERMNRFRRGGQYAFPDSLVRWLVIWKQLVDYRGLEGITRKLCEMKVIPYHPDYTTIWYRIHALHPEIEIARGEYEAASDGSGLKSSNAGEYRIMKYGDPLARQRKHLIVVITADVRTKKLLGISARIEGPGRSEGDDASEHILSAVKRGAQVSTFYGDGAFDSNKVFHLLGTMSIEPVIKIHRNASPDTYKGSKYRRRAIRKYQELRYSEWKEQNHYGMRWPGTEGIFSAVKRKFGENTVSRSQQGLISEGYQRLWSYDQMREYGERRAKT